MDVPDEVSNLEAFYEAQAVSANNAWNEGRYDEADTICTELLLDSRLPPLWRALCNLLLATGSADTAPAYARDAIRWYDHCLETLPDSTYLQGQRHEAARQLRDAEQRRAQEQAADAAAEEAQVDTEEVAAQGMEVDEKADLEGNASGGDESTGFLPPLPSSPVETQEETRGTKRGRSSSPTESFSKDQAARLSRAGTETIAVPTFPDHAHQLKRIKMVHEDDVTELRGEGDVGISSAKGGDEVEVIDAKSEGDVQATGEKAGDDAEISRGTIEGEPGVSREQGEEDVEVRGGDVEEQGKSSQGGDEA